jgi:GNAT superfamily N-acetyltransferase
VDEPSIRPARQADITDLARVQLSSALTAFASIFPSSVPAPTLTGLESEWRALLVDGRQHTLVTELNRRVIGVVAFGQTETGRLGNGCVLRKLYVDPDWWGGGVGSLLHDHAVAGLRSMGCTDAHLWVLERNVAARRMYEARGWKLRPWTRSDWPGTGILELCYSLELSTRL